MDMLKLDSKLKNKIYNEIDSNNDKDNEYLLNPDNNRLTIYPIQNDLIWNSYKKQQAAIWFAEEIDFSKDYEDFNKLSNNEKYFIKMILGFFSSSDTIVNINLAERFLNDVKIREAIVVYTWQMAMESIHCCSGDTLILLKNGYFPIETLENKIVDIWNGKKFSETIIKYTGDSILYQIELSNKIILKCTPKHKWFIEKNNKKEIIFTDNLKINDKIYKYELPIIDPKDPEIFINPYYHGYFSGTDSTISIENINKDKYFVPINYSIETKLRWLEGLLDAFNSNIIKHNNLDFLNNIQLMLHTLSINPYITYDENKQNHCLFLNSDILFNLQKLGLCPKNQINVNIDYNIINNDLIITNITKINGIHKTFCFCEHEEHAGIFNGILTGQSETYSLQIDNIIRDKEEKNKLFNAVKELPCIADKIDWSVKWIESNHSFQTRLIAFAIVEGIFFSGSFCAIFWLKKRNIMPGLCMSNELIARDEGMHTQFAVLLYSMIANKISESQIHEMFKDAVAIEAKFICESLPCSLLGMNADLMKQYIKFVADRLLIDLGYTKIFHVTNPFDFMESISIEGKTNFFEARPTQYQKSSVLNKSREFNFVLTNDF
jgi:ribonucleotide reductase beta subunit family protein with ferritin-like domain